jgi:transcriptional regulator with XRE-family HTH domain
MTVNGIEFDTTCRYACRMDAGRLLRTARQRAGLSLRQLAERAETSHSALAAYESGRTVPNVDTFDRVVRSAGFEVDVVLTPRPDAGDRGARGSELIEVLELAEMFPARHSATLTFPRFGATHGDVA